jgi:hypothetical protein
MIKITIYIGRIFKVKKKDWSREQNGVT